MDSPGVRNEPPSHRCDECDSEFRGQRAALEHSCSKDTARRFVCLYEKGANDACRHSSKSESAIRIHVKIKHKLRSTSSKDLHWEFVESDQERRKRHERISPISSSNTTDPEARMALRFHVHTPEDIARKYKSSEEKRDVCSQPRSLNTINDPRSRFFPLSNGPSFQPNEGNTITTHPVMHTNIIQPSLVNADVYGSPDVNEAHQRALLQSQETSQRLYSTSLQLPDSTLPQPTQVANYHARHEPMGSGAHAGHVHHHGQVAHEVFAPAHYNPQREIYGMFPNHESAQPVHETPSTLMTGTMHAGHYPYINPRTTREMPYGAPLSHTGVYMARGVAPEAPASVSPISDAQGASGASLNHDERYRQESRWPSWVEDDMGEMYQNPPNYLGYHRFL